MANLDTFISTDVVSALVEESYRKYLVFGSVCNNKYVPDSMNTSSVQIPVIGDIDINNYTANQSLTYQNPVSTSQTLYLNEQRYFAFNIDTLYTDRAKANLVAVHADRAGHNLANNVDATVERVMVSGITVTGSGAAYVLGASGAAVSVTAAATGATTTSVYEYTTEFAKALDVGNVPQAGRWIIVPPSLHQKMVMARTLESYGAGAGENGKVGRMMGFDVYVSNNITNSTSADNQVAIAGHSSAIAMVSQIQKTDYLPIRDGTFGEGYRTLLVFGCKLVNVPGLALGTFTVSAG
jgi:hypothetical protein